MCHSQNVQKYTIINVQKLTKQCQRQDNIRIEQKPQAKTWDKRMATSIFSIYCVDTWLIYRKCTEDLLNPDPQLNQQEF